MIRNHKHRFLAWGARGRKFESCHPDPSKQRASEISEALYFLTGLHMVYINDFLLSLYINKKFNPVVRISKHIIFV